MPISRSAVIAAVCAAAVSFCPLPAHASSVPAGPEGDAFYTPPSPLPSGKRGSVIWARSFEGTMALPSAAKNVLVLYRSAGAKGGTVAVSGTVAIPRGTAPRGGWPVITWTHGTTGLAPVCAPSRDTGDGPEHPYIAIIQTLLDGFVKQGYAVVASDYEGLGTPGMHPFLQGVPTGRNALDMMRAARAIEPKLGKRYVVMGHSQGGQVDLFAASLGPAYAPEFKQVGNVAFAPASGVESRLRALTVSPHNELALPYLVYVLQSYAWTNPAIKLDRILTPEAIAHMPDLQQGCMTHALSQGYWSTAIAKDQFVAKPDLAAFLKMVAKNEPGTLHIKTPTLVVQGTDDVTVLPKDTDATVKGLCAKGNVVTYHRAPGADHNGSMQKGAYIAHDWVTARFAGQKTAGDCKAPPSAKGN